MPRGDPGPDLRSMIPGVTCVRCHESAGDHAVKGTPMVPTKLDRAGVMNLCVSCHRLPAERASRSPEAKIAFDSFCSRGPDGERMLSKKPTYRACPATIRTRMSAIPPRATKRNASLVTEAKAYIARPTRPKTAFAATCSSDLPLHISRSQTTAFGSIAPGERITARRTQEYNRRSKRRMRSRRDIRQLFHC